MLTPLFFEPLEPLEPGMCSGDRPPAQPPAADRNFCLFTQSPQQLWFHPPDRRLTEVLTTPPGRADL
ncbi:hypothetical protein [Prochlorothrix hollandica]|uniref:hypothetical protein n=1 Tax=Prochlorothrix hollandica TaxID=1223 RepID=UPI0011D23144|nr:hypothetical protein [Prochlorothrix hollandica]